MSRTKKYLMTNLTFADKMNCGILASACSIVSTYYEAPHFGVSTINERERPVDLDCKIFDMDVSFRGYFKSLKPKM